jgi:membrane protein YdbS with pleckstrin-like domain
MDEGSLTPLDPAYIKVLRIRAAITAVPISVGALVLESAEALPRGAVILPVLLVAALVILRLPLRRWQARGYRLESDRLQVVAGMLFRRDTVVPFGRVQHIDVEQGPLERFYGLGTLVLHTAGNHNASVQLSGLRHGDAVGARDSIRDYVKREIG